MFSRIVIVCFLSIVCCGETVRAADAKQAEAFVQVAKEHYALHDLARSAGKAPSPSTRGLMEVRYDLPSGGRFATYLISPMGELKLMVLNGKTNKHYIRTARREILLQKLMAIVAPESTPAERQWGAKQLDSVWSERVRPLPVRIGNYVFSATTVQGPLGAHDKFEVVRADTGATGLKYPGSERFSRPTE